VLAILSLTELEPIDYIIHENKVNYYKKFFIETIVQLKKL